MGAIVGGRAMDTCEVIVVGAGMWGKQWIEKILEHPGLQLAAVVAKTDETLHEVAERYHVPRKSTFRDLREATETTAADLVVVVSPPSCHLEHIRIAIESGKHVICEKPLADTWDAALGIAHIVRSRPDRKFMVSQTRRFTNQVNALRQAIVSGRIGEPDIVTFDHRVNYTGGGYRQRMDFPVLEDMICHHLDAFRYITGQEAVSVYTEAWNPGWSQFTGRASNTVLAVMTGGIHVNYFGSWTSRGQLNSYDGVMKVMGSEGSLDLEDENTLLYYPFTGEETAPNPVPERIPIVELEHREIAGVIHAFLHALDNDEPPPCDIEDNLRTFAFNWAALQSCKSGRRIPLRDGLIIGE